MLDLSWNLSFYITLQIQYNASPSITAFPIRKQKLRRKLTWNWQQMYHSSGFRSSRLEVFLGKSALKICGKFTGYHPCRSVISIKLQSNFIEITIRPGCSLVNLLHIFGIPFTRNTSEWPRLMFELEIGLTDGGELNFDKSFLHFVVKK